MKIAGKFIISLDFEKFWGMRDHKSINEYEENLRKVDEICISLLNIFEDYGIHATWATVGFLAFDNKEELIKSLPSVLPSYKDSNLCPYKYIQQNKLRSEFHFGDEIIRKIISTKGQELASHTLSHYYCLAQGQSSYSFEQDVIGSINIFKAKYNLDTETVVFPRNQVNQEYDHILLRYGVKTYRGNETNWIYKREMNYQLKRLLRLIDSVVDITGPNTYKIDKISHDQLLNIPSSRFLRPVSLKYPFINKLRLNRIKSQIRHAAIKGEIFHLWWHPHNFGNNVEKNIEFLILILDYFKKFEMSYDFKSVNMKELKDSLKI